mmetsp:Transcript_128763/g.248069  ORF Transcript_128763/g.248069 Transcript_128763/m.248069 type:complete len:217 (+) Transcript_128763:202-852(+)
MRRRLTTGRRTRRRKCPIRRRMMRMGRKRMRRMAMVMWIWRRRRKTRRTRARRKRRRTRRRSRSQRRRRQQKSKFLMRLQSPSTKDPGTKDIASGPGCGVSSSALSCQWAPRRPCPSKIPRCGSFRWSSGETSWSGQRARTWRHTSGFSGLSPLAASIRRVRSIRAAMQPSGPSCQQLTFSSSWARASSVSLARGYSLTAHHCSTRGRPWKQQAYE